MKDIIVTIIAVIVACALVYLLIGNHNDSTITKTKNLFEKQVEVLSE